MTQPDAFAISSSYQRGCCCLAPAGDLDLKTAESLLALATERLREPGVPALVVDLERVTFLDSSGLRVLFAIGVHAGELGKRLTLRSPSPAVRRVIEVARLHTVIPLTG